MSSFRKSCFPSWWVLSTGADEAEVLAAAEYDELVCGTWTWFRKVDEVMSGIAANLSSVRRGSRYVRPRLKCRHAAGHPWRPPTRGDRPTPRRSAHPPRRPGA